MRTLLLFFTVFTLGSAFAQNTGTSTVKMDFTHYPTLPIKGMETLGIEVYTGDLPFNMDTLRLYLGNMDILKSGGERLSKIDHQALTDVNVIGGRGDVTISMAFGPAKIGAKKMSDAPCIVAKDGCKQYLYTVQYQLPAVVQASNADGVLETWALDSNMELQFGNEQIETQSNANGGSTTTIRTVSFSSPENLEKGFASMGEAWLARKGAMIQLREMIDSSYPRLFFEQDQLKFDIAYGKGSAADYSDTETAAEAAVAALESKNFAALDAPIGVWESWLERHEPGNKKAAVNHKVAQGLHENLSVAYTFTGKYEKAHTNVDKALELAQQGMVNTNEVDRLKKFHTFIDDQEKAQQHNGAIVASGLVPGPDLKKILGRRKFNEDLNFIIPEDRYADMGGESGMSSSTGGEATLEDALNNLIAEGSTTSYADRAQSGTLVLTTLFDSDLKGQPVPSSVCELTGLKTLNARNLSLTAVPECIGQLSGLTKLILDGNAITSLPDVFASLPELSTIDISDNQLTGLPDSFFGLKNLKKLTISGNQIPKEQMDRLQSAMPDCKIK
jgi:hypothetical protein